MQKHSSFHYFLYPLLLGQYYAKSVFPKCLGEARLKLSKYDQPTLISTFRIRLRLKPMLCSYMFNNQLFRRGKNKPWLNSICKFPGEILPDGWFQGTTPPWNHHHGGGKRCTHRRTWAGARLRVSEVTPLAEHNSKSPQ